MADDVEKIAAGGWRTIDSAPYAQVIDLWCQSVEGEGWRKTGYLTHHNPQRLLDEDGYAYFPHENGGWFSHWMPLPAPPNECIGGEE
jgi:hypothetical protein